MTFPIDRAQYRTFDPNFCGELFTCDIDRTYLATRLSSLRGMALIPFEAAIDKNAVDGMKSVLKEIRRGPNIQSRHTPLYFVSASPAQLRSVIERKMLLDGLEYDGTTFKDWVGVVRQGRLSRFREQIGFKLTALLSNRIDYPARAIDVLIGDDNESDPLAYAIYADIAEKRTVGDEIAKLLRSHRVLARDIRTIMQLALQLPSQATVKRAYIRLDRYPDPEYLIDYAPNVVGCLGSLQLAIALWTDGSIALSGVVQVAREQLRAGESAEALTKHFADAARRGLVRPEAANSLQSELIDASAIHRGPIPAVDVTWAAAMQRSVGRWTPTRSQ